MTSIELPEDYSQPGRVTLGQTLLRIALGTILVAHGIERYFAVQSFQDELASRFSLLEPAAVAHGLIAAEVVGGAFLIFGWLTRFGALALLVSGCGSIALEFLRQGGFVHHAAYELPGLLGIGGLYFLLAGGGPASLDVALRSRARRRAIENDSLWLRHPYVADEVTGEDDYRSFGRRVYERR